MSIPTAIKVSDMTKTFLLYQNPPDRLKEVLHPFRKIYHKPFNALDNISFQVQKGSTLGIIGENGAGKSTLLKIISGVLTPTSGCIEVNGKIATLLELGVGFNPEMTGSENINIFCTLMNVPHYLMKTKMREISDFAEIGNYIDQPVKTYSSGMYAKLAFSSAIHVEPDVLVIDEILSVGDDYFQQKSFGKITELKSQGTTLLFCSHSMFQIQEICDEVIWLQSGKIKMAGDPVNVSNAYISYSRKKSAEVNNEPTEKNKKTYFSHIQLNRKTMKTGETIAVELTLQNSESVTQGLKAAVSLTRNDSIDVFTTKKDSPALEIPGNSSVTITFEINNCPLLSGEYYFICFLFHSESLNVIDQKKSDIFTVNSQKDEHGIVRINHRWLL